MGAITSIAFTPKGESMGNIVQFHEGFLKKAIRIREERIRDEKRKEKDQIQNTIIDTKETVREERA